MLALLACGHTDRATVYGRVTRQDDSPLAGARVMAKSADGQFARGVTDADGRYELGVAEYGDGVPPGDYHVSIHEDRGDRRDRIPRTVPEKYENPEQSGLGVKVSAGETSELNIMIEPL